MKKILLIILTLLMLTACSKQDGGNANNSKENFKKSNKFETNVYLPTDWGVKSGTYGDHYTDFDSIILIQEIKSDMKKEFQESLNFYNSGLIRLNDDLKLEKKDDHYVSKISGEKEKYIIAKNFKDKGKEILLSIIADTQDRAYELYKEVFR